MTEYKVILDTDKLQNFANTFIDINTYKRLEQENKELKAYKDVNEDFKKAWDELNKKYTEVLKLAKENADSNEYCLQELEQKNKELRSEIAELRKDCNHCNFHTYRSALEEIKNLIKGHKVADEVRLKSILNKINEVLQ